MSVAIAYPMLVTAVSRPPFVHPRYFLIPLAVLQLILVSAAGRASPRFVEGVCCDRCFDTLSQAQRTGALERDRQVRLAAERGQAHIGVRPPPKA